MGSFNYNYICSYCVYLEFKKLFFLQLDIFALSTKCFEIADGNDLELV